MSVSNNPCLSLAIARLTAAGPDNFAIWTMQSPLPGGYVHHDCTWPETLTQKWLAWQEMFSLSYLPDQQYEIGTVSPNLENLNLETAGKNFSGRLMQDLGINLWQWLFDGAIRHSLDRSEGIAIGQNQPLRLRLEIRDPNLIPLPWEIMQSAPGKQAISLNQQLLFSRTSSDVEPISQKLHQEVLNILLVLGTADGDENLHLKQEATTLAREIEAREIEANTIVPPVPAGVDILEQPSAEELIEALETGPYNVICYSGHGLTSIDGGLLLLRPDATLNGTELAQVLVRNQITLAVFNACWGAGSYRHNGKTIERSSLAEVLIHHGVPAVLAMRDEIADQEALSFMSAFAKALRERMPVDLAVAVARQKLLTLYKFNQPAWTLPILYMHSEFDGELIKPINEGITELPNFPTTLSNKSLPVAYLRSLKEKDKSWPIRGGFMRVGRGKGNDLMILEKWVSQQHAEIIRREIAEDSNSQNCYFIRDFSRFGTLIYLDGGWRKIYHQEVSLESGVQIRFGSDYGEIFEFLID